MRSCNLLQKHNLANLKFENSQEKRDLVTGLKSRTKAGRPNWDKVFDALKKQHKGQITVFYCGNPAVAEILRAKCRQFGFKFSKEVF